MLIAFEGIDGSGKGTQAELLKGKALSVGMTAEILSFPRYGKTLFAKCIASHLNGDFGDLTSIAASTTALLFAGDRLESRTTLMQLAQSYDVLILDRYVASNLAHQGARVSPEERSAFTSWLARLEYEMFALPEADLTIYLDMPVEMALQMIHKKKPRSYTTKAADIYESDLNHLILCREVYQTLVDTNFHSKWLVLPCMSHDGQLRDASEIQASIWHAIQQENEMFS